MKIKNEYLLIFGRRKEFQRQPTKSTQTEATNNEDRDSTLNKGTNNQLMTIQLQRLVTVFTNFRALLHVNYSLQWLHRLEDTHTCCFFLALQLTTMSLDMEFDSYGDQNRVSTMDIWVFGNKSPLQPHNYIPKVGLVGNTLIYRRIRQTEDYILSVDREQDSHEPPLLVLKKARKNVK